MNKKFLSTVLFGALLLGSASTIVSCKDYDDDIQNLQTQVNDVKAALAALEAKVAQGKYVTSVNSTATGVTITLNDGSSYTVTNGKDGADGAPGAAGADGKDGAGSVVSINEDGFFVIDGKTTEWKAVADDNGLLKAPFVKDGVWVFFDEDGNEDVSTYRVAPVTAVQNADKSYTLTVYAADGTSQVVKIPSAATLITSIRFKELSTSYNPFTISEAIFYKPSKWAGEKTLPADKSVVVSASTLDVRIDPVNAPAEDVTFYLTNTKNKTLSHVALTAVPEAGNDPITIGNIATRANNGNGLFTLVMPQFVLTKAEAANFNKELADIAKPYDMNTGTSSVWDNCNAFAVNANLVARSAYAVAIAIDDTPALTAIQVANVTGTRTTLGSTGNLTATLNKTYTIAEATNEEGRMFDMYFTVSEKDQKTYGVVFDNLKRTFSVTKNPDVSTAASGFNLLVNTLDTNGNVSQATITVTLDHKISNAMSYDAVTYNIAQLLDTNSANDAFVLDMAIMKNALGDKWTQWANDVDLDYTAYELFTSEGCEILSKAASVGAPTTSLACNLVDANWGAANENTLKYLVVSPKTANANTLELDKQYYLKVTFKADAVSEINSIVVPVTFTAPSVSEQFAKKSGYTNTTTGVIEAYFYNIANKDIELKRYFDKFDASATIAMDNEDVVKSKYNVDYTSDDLATLGTATNMTTAKLNLVSTTSGVLAPATDGTEFGYGEVLTINAVNANYASTGWGYSSDEKKAYSFQIKVMSPIHEGTVKPVTGNTIKISANATEGFNITKDMITGADYNNNVYNVVPDKEVAFGGAAAWANDQIASVTVGKKAGNTYIKDGSPTIVAATAKDDTHAAVAGAINVKADPLPNEQVTEIIVTVADKWGYTISKEVSVTITKN